MVLTFKREKKMSRYGNRVVKQVESYGFGNYKNKSNSVCFWTKDAGNMVSYDAGKMKMFGRKIRFKIEFYLKRLLGVY